MDTELAIGNFVTVEGNGNEDGTGKLVALRTADGDIEYVESPFGPRLVKKTVRREEIRRVEPAPQTRVFCLDKPTGRLTAGRLVGPITSALALRADEDHYPVRFPNGNNVMVGESALYVRWARPISDPLDYLSSRVTETPFFYTSRSALEKHLAFQRAAFHGLSGLASSAVELMAHQVAAIHRIACDPVQRYLVALDPGLGKSVIAGAIVRQHLGENKAAQVLVLVPKHQLPVWENDCEVKFFVDEDARLVVRDEPPAEADAKPPTLLVIDDAHRYAKAAFSNSAAERKRFEAIAALCRRAQRVLVLTNKPVLHNEDAYLAMLHLVDGAAFPLRDREAFARRVRDRQPIADLIADLGDEASDETAASALERLESLNIADATLGELIKSLRAVKSGKKAAEKKQELRRALRDQLRESQRLHPRLLRIRRDDPRLEDHLPKRNGLVQLSCEDGARTSAFELLEGWRKAALSAITAASKEKQAAYATLFAQWVEAALSHPRVLLRAIDARLTKRELELFSGEETLLRNAKTQLAKAVAEEPRAKKLAHWLAGQPKTRKLLVFVDDAEVAEQVTSRLRELLTPEAVIRYDGIAAGQKFEARAQARILVCDGAAEPGLTLQESAAAIVHYDLPFLSGRIEQRISRRERVAARGRLHNLVFEAVASYEREWRAALENALRIFNRSVAPCARRIGDGMARIREQLLGQGAAAITAEAARFADAANGLDAEIARVIRHEALDESGEDSPREPEFFAAFEAADEACEEKSRAIFEEWMVRCLQFLPRGEKDDDDVRYVYSLSRPTLLPLDDALAWFAALIDHGIEERTRSELPLLLCTFSRAVSESEHIGLMRIGHPLIDVLEPMLRSDDRGCTFALWRVAPEVAGPPQRYFGFDFIVEADGAPIAAALEAREGLPALRRRADAALGVEYRTLWLDGALQPVSDAALIALLERPYSADKRGGSDVNLRAERWPAVDALLPVADWPALCARARDAAVQSLRKSPALRERSANAVKELAATSRDLDEKLVQALATSVRTPSLRLAAAGVVYLATEKLPGPELPE